MMRALNSKNLFDIYLPIVEGALIFDNSFGMPDPIGQKKIEDKLIVINETKFNELKRYYDNH